MLVILTPVREEKRILNLFYHHNKRYLHRYPWIVIDSSGIKEKYKKDIDFYVFNPKLNLREARKLGYDIIAEKFKDAKFVFNLDSDVVIPNHYISNAKKTFNNHRRVGAVSLFFKGRSHRGILEYGVSILRRKLTLVYPTKIPTGYCECLKMWENIMHLGYHIRIIPPYFARHLP